MRWKAIFFDEENDPDEEEQHIETFGLKTTKTPRQVLDLIEFEKELIGIVPKLKFHKGMNNFQSKLKNDIISINQSDEMFVPADKTTNLYKMDKNDYNKLLNDSITSTYKKANPNIVNKINDAGKEILKDHFLADRFDVNGKNNCFVTLKDHEVNFLNHPTTRLSTRKDK